MRRFDMTRRRPYDPKHNGGCMKSNRERNRLLISGVIGALCVGVIACKETRMGRGEVKRDLPGAVPGTLPAGQPAVNTDPREASLGDLRSRSFVIQVADESGFND